MLTVNGYCPDVICLPRIIIRVDLVFGAVITYCWQALKVKVQGSRNGSSGTYLHVFMHTRLLFR